MSPLPSPQLRVAIIDDEPDVARVIGRWLERFDAVAVHLQHPPEIESLIARADEHDYDVILLDVNMPKWSGLEILHRLQGRGASTAVVMVTGDDSADTATKALRAGAYHYLVKTRLNDHAMEVVRMAAAQTATVRKLRAPSRAITNDLDAMVVGDSASTSDLRQQIRQVAASSVNVLVTGESGTGKEVVARAVHRMSARAAQPFVPLNCGSIPEGLIDSELFGHVRGAFTGAITARAGVFVEADRGTLFLDEIGDMPMAVQARLLRTLQDGEVRPVGGDTARSTDARLVAATHVDLSAAVAAGRFRADLLFRLNVVNLVVRPLRERHGDMPALIAVLLRKHAPDPQPQLTARALEAMHAYPWPGNVRELENALLHALAMKAGEEIDLADLPPAIGGRPLGFRGQLAVGSGVLAKVGDNLPLTEAKRAAALDFERAYLLELMERAHGSVSAAARIAGIDRTNFRRLLQRHDIDSSQFRH